EDGETGRPVRRRAAPPGGHAGGSLVPSVRGVVRRRGVAGPNAHHRHRGQELVVVGGGDSAMEEAIFLTRFATRVTVVHRRRELRASKIMQDRAFANPKIDFRWNTVVTDVEGNGRVEQLGLRDTVTDETSDLKVGGLFVAIGHDPNTKLFEGQ